ncbi:MAG: CopG family transcriptional regulator [Armatimonadetes bacterium]|nr:CopG family transcriptional regulator [Armatimonadota bacterium]
MRTTITIDDHLLEELKKRAARAGTTVSRLIEDAVRSTLGPSQAAPKRDFRLVTFGGTGRFTDVDLDKTSRLLEHDDISRFSDH